MRWLPLALLLACPVLARAQSSGVVHTPEVDLAYQTLGTATKAPPLFAVNGGPGLTHAYMVQNDLWQRFSRTREVVFYDQRGMGGSTRVAPGAPQTMEAQVADLEAVRAHLHAERIDLVGDSFGGLLVLAYTLAHPEHVAHLVVSDGLPGWGTIVHPLPDIFPDLDQQAAATLQAMPPGPARDNADMRAHLRECFYSPELAQRYLAGFPQTGYNAAVGEAVGNATGKVDLTPHLGEIKIPTLVLTGRFDVNVAPVTAWRMAQAIPGARFHVFEHSGHLPSYEEPDAYFATVESFLAGKE